MQSDSQPIQGVNLLQAMELVEEDYVIAVCWVRRCGEGK
jgi:hypothetical protein